MTMDDDPRTEAGALHDMGILDVVEMEPHDALRRQLGLTPTEWRVMLAVVDGQDNAKEIARAIGTSPRTIEIHMSSIKAKLGAKTKLQAALIVDRALRGGDPR